MNSDLYDGVLARRFTAWVADLVLVGLLAMLAWVALALFGVMTFGAALPLLGLLTFIPVLYHLLFVASAGSATPGQRMLDLVVRREDDLGPPGWGRALLFTAGLYVTLGAGAIWFGIALLTPRRRAVHDVVAGVVVVRRSALRRRERLLVTSPELTRSRATARIERQ